MSSIDSLHQLAAEAPKFAFRKLSVVIPAYNERTTIIEILRRVCAAPFDKEVIIVDDGSVDGTRDELAGLGLAPDRSVVVEIAGVRSELRLILHQENGGKGTSVSDGIAAATGEITVIQDADLEYDPVDYAKLLQPILDGKADVVFGSRFTGTPRRVLFFWHEIGNKFLTFFSNMFTNLNLTDMETCYKAFRTDLVKNMPLRSARFGIEPELTAKFARLRARIYEVPISYAGRSYIEGKKIGWKDGFAAIWTILKYAFIDDLENADAGYKTLQRMEAVKTYNRWLWEKVEPWVGDHVLEVGSGTGNMTSLLSRRPRVVATDLSDRYLRLLTNTFRGDPHVRVSRLDLGAATLPDDIERDFDTIVCLNVLEHIEDDSAALSRLYESLAPGGRLVLIIPALRALYGEIDRALHHHRRYERDEIIARLQAAGFEVEHVSWFNSIGVPGWYLNSVLLRRKSVPGLQARLNSWLVPVLRLERHLSLRFGMSLLAVGRRPTKTGQPAPETPTTAEA